MNILKRLSAPRSLQTTALSATRVTLKWRAPKGAKPAYYVVYRDGRSIGRTTRREYTDKKVKAGRTYRYTVRGFDKRKKAGALTKSVRVKVPKATAPTTNPVPQLAPVAPAPVLPAPPAPPAPPVLLSAAMVDRLFWRAGFGPSAADRETWTGRPVDELLDWFVSTPAEAPPAAGTYDAFYAAAARPPRTAAGETIDPLASDVELELEWIDRMQRAVNPLPDRLAFFWHRHWAVSREDGIPNQWVLNYRNRLLRHADFGRYPGATFRSLAIEMTSADTAMSMYLNINQNVKGKPNENYARELMELFCLGPKAPDGTPNYSQDDVAGLAKALTGWTYNGNSSSPDYGKVSFVPGRFELTAKTFLGVTLPAIARTADVKPETGPATVATAVDTVLAHRNHAQFLIRKLWAEFIAAPIPQATLDALVASYRASGYALRPLIRAILGRPEIFESLDEPNLIKPPVVQLVGVLRCLDAPLKNSYMEQAMNNMQQRVYWPPNVSGWEGGLSWLNTNTVQGRFDLVVKAQYLKYSNHYSGTARYPPDTPGETPQQVFDRAYASVNAPWLGAATRARLLAYAAELPAANQNGTKAADVTARRQRFYALQAMMLGGPDGQVM
jgi:uncharacterized protein (DUF1800 family)